MIPGPWLLGYFTPGGAPPFVRELATSANVIWRSVSSGLLTSRDWQASRVLCREVEGARAAILGDILLDHDRLAHRLTQCVSKSDYTELTRAPGAFTVVVEEADRIFVSSHFVGVQPLYFRRVSEGSVFSSSCLLLRQLFKADVSPEWLATRLVAPDIPDLIDSESPFIDIEAVRPGCWLTLSRDEVRVTRYWAPPEATVALEEGALRLRDALSSSVEARATGDQLTADMSGGFDSTLIATLAARTRSVRSQTLRTLTYGLSNEPGFNDLQYARAVAASHPNLEAAYVELRDLPKPFEDAVTDALMEEPSLLNCTLARFENLVGRIAALGSNLHLTGDGGDAVGESPISASLVTLARRREVRALVRSASITAGRAREAPITVFKRAIGLTRMSYGQWLARQARFVRRGQTDTQVGWAYPAEPPPWLSPYGADLVSNRLETYSREAPGYAEDLPAHASVAQIVTSSTQFRSALPVAARFGVHLQSPFLDLPVVEICLAIRPEEKSVPGKLKPLFVEAFRDLLPPTFFDRREKNAGWFFTRDFYGALATSLRSRPRWLNSIALADLGVIDGVAFRDAVGRFEHGLPDSFFPTMDTLAMEMWLRTLFPQ